MEKSLELLDKVLSEFEEEQPENTPAGEPESPSQGHQSEDDGYMSMNGRRLALKAFTKIFLFLSTSLIKTLILFFCLCLFSSRLFMSRETSP